MSDELLVFGVSDFVAYANQTLEYAYPYVVIEGELANLKLSKNRWVYLDLKDEMSSLRFFGTIYQLGSPVENGMRLRVRGTPRLHPQYGFTINIQQIELVGEGTINRAAQILTAKLEAEGLFDVSRKRPLPYAPSNIGLITSGESAAYADFTKIVSARWTHVTMQHVDVQVQGANSPAQIVAAIAQLNQLAEPPEALVIIRGGGSSDDLQAFNDERVVRAVAASRIPTVVAIGHENDTSLAELAADQRASTPSNAAELLVPDKLQLLQTVFAQQKTLSSTLSSLVHVQHTLLAEQVRRLSASATQAIADAARRVGYQKELLHAFNPEAALQRGYAIIRTQGRVLRSITSTAIDDIVEITLNDGTIAAKVTSLQSQKGNTHAK